MQSDRLLLLLPASSYRTTDFLRAADRTGTDLIIGTDQELTINSLVDDRVLTMDFNRTDTAATTIAAWARTRPLEAIVGVDESTTLIAALASAELGLVHNTPQSIEYSHNKYLFRRALQQAGILNPEFQLVDDHVIQEAAARWKYPCVLKPLSLTGSRGVIRVDDQVQFVSAYHRIRRILDHSGGPDAQNGHSILVESFIEGNEFALEGILWDGQLEVIALYDKPDPLNGPYFEETIYVTPSLLCSASQSDINNCVQQACKALGLTTGPIHAEVRVNDAGCWIIELAARSIGGRCSRTVLLEDDLTLEELILKQAMDRPTARRRQLADASGVMMIPAPGKGRLESISGLSRARATEGITDVQIEVRPGEQLVPLPDGNRYLGFIFARADASPKVTEALRLAHGCLSFKIMS